MDLRTLAAMAGLESLTEDNINEGFTHHLRKKILKDDDYRNGEVWQAVLNIVHNDWQRAEGKGYDDILAYVEARYGELAELAVMLAKYNYQVENGGHAQYFDNGYAGGARGWGDYTDEDMGIHNKMISLMEKYGLSTGPVGSTVYEIMKDFEVRPDTCEYCKGDGTIKNPEYEEWGNAGGEHDPEFDDHDLSDVPEEWVDCEECNGTGEDERRYTGESPHLDDRYYAINDQWKKEFENFLERELSTQRQFESIESDSDDELNESITITTTIDDNNGKSITVSATDAEAEELSQLLQLSGSRGQNSDTGCGCGGPKMEDDQEGFQSWADEEENWEQEDDLEEEYENSPNPRYDDVETMMISRSGGLNKPKRQYHNYRVGDNPRAVRETLELKWKNFKDK